MQTYAKRGIACVLRRHTAVDRARWMSTEAPTKDKFRVVVLGGGASKFAAT